MYQLNLFSFLKQRYKTKWASQMQTPLRYLRPSIPNDKCEKFETARICQAKQFSKRSNFSYRVICSGPILSGKPKIEMIAILKSSKN